MLSFRICGSQAANHPWQGRVTPQVPPEWPSSKLPFARFSKDLKLQAVCLVRRVKKGGLSISKKPFKLVSTRAAQGDGSSSEEVQRRPTTAEPFLTPNSEGTLVLSIGNLDQGDRLLRRWLICSPWKLAFLSLVGAGLANVLIPRLWTVLVPKALKHILLPGYASLFRGSNSPAVLFTNVAGSLLLLIMSLITSPWYFLAPLLGAMRPRLLDRLLSIIITTHFLRGLSTFSRRLHRAIEDPTGVGRQGSFLDIYTSAWRGKSLGLLLLVCFTFPLLAWYKKETFLPLVESSLFLGGTVAIVLSFGACTFVAGLYKLVAHYGSLNGSLKGQSSPTSGLTVTTIAQQAQAQVSVAGPSTQFLVMLASLMPLVNSLVHLSGPPKDHLGADTGLLGSPTALWIYGLPTIAWMGRAVLGGFLWPVEVNGSLTVYPVLGNLCSKVHPLFGKSWCVALVLGAVHVRLRWLLEKAIAEQK